MILSYKFLFDFLIVYIEKEIISQESKIDNFSTMKECKPQLYLVKGNV